MPPEEWETLPGLVLIRICGYANGTFIFNKLRLVCREFYMKLPLHNDIKKIYLEEKYIQCQNDMDKIICEYFFHFSNGFFIWYMRHFGLRLDHLEYNCSLQCIFYLISHGITIMNEKTKKHGFQGVDEKYVHILSNLYDNPQTKLMVGSESVFRTYLLEYYIYKQDKKGIKEMYMRYKEEIDLFSRHFDCHKTYDEEFILWLMQEFKDVSLQRMIKYIAFKKRFRKVLKIYTEQKPFDIDDLHDFFYYGHYDLLKEFFNDPEIYKRYFNKKGFWPFIYCLYEYYESINNDESFAQWSYEILTNEFYINSNKILQCDDFYTYCLRYDCVDFLKKHINEFREWIYTISEITKFDLICHACNKESMTFLFNEFKLDKDYFEENLEHILTNYSYKFNMKNINVFFEFYGEPNEYTIKILLATQYIIFHYESDVIGMMLPNRRIGYESEINTLLEFCKTYDRYITVDTITTMKNWETFINHVDVFNYLYKKFGKKTVWDITINLSHTCNMCGHKIYYYVYFYKIYKRIGFHKETIAYLNSELKIKKCSQCIFEILKILCLCKHNKGAKKIKLKLKDPPDKIKRMCGVIGVMVDC